MSDLISRRKIRDYIQTQINPYGKPFEGSAYELGLKIMKYIDAMDSAYDVDKVVEKLRESEMCPRCANNHNTISHCATFCDLGKKLEFVRKGGVE